MAMAAYSGKKAPVAPRAVGRYDLKEKLGEGGMGVVWRALDTKTGGDVALKIMKDISDPDALELFTKEWRALAEMCHPNIVDVRDVDVLIEGDEQKPFFVMPLLRGATLSDLIKLSSERLTVSRVVEIMSQVCRGLQAAHQRGLIHRDLKPSNIFVMDDDTAKVIDFGVVYLAGTHSITGQKGTYQYMSPEQVQMKEVTPASDIFSLGVILYEALTARKPFACGTVDETMQAVLKRIPLPVSELNPTIPHAISQVVHKCLAKQAIHRFSSARELSETLQKALRNEPVFDTSKLRLRVERAKAAFKTGDEAFASEVLSELESEGHLDPEITVLRMQIDMATKQKKIRQLLESARARFEQDEIPLGLDKLREVFELDPENADALALKTSTEKKRNEAQASKWVELANTHLGNSDFSAARQAVREALASRAGDPRALDLAARIESMELDAKRVREQKEQLYNTAMKAYQNGEIDSALSRMVRLFSVVRSKPEGAVPERDAVYESFYKEVRSEHDAIRLALEEAQHQFSEENFTRALALCAEQLVKYPNNGAFQALKIQIEDEERQKVSAYIAIVSKNVDSEPDLDRRANILREACERYPAEAQFAQQLKTVRERRDLVNSIVAKAHQFGERGQYNEELSQWDMLRNIHPRYPGLAFELEQCKKKRDQQAQDEEKAQLVQEIVNLMEARQFTRALERTKLAMIEFPADAELTGLEKLSTEGLERSQEANRLFEAGKSEASTNNWSKAVELLQGSLALEPRNATVKDFLINVLTEQGRNLLEFDSAQADRLHKEASALDANHPAVRSLGIELSEARRQSYVGECLTQARAMVAVGNSAAAYERIREGRKEYPKDTRLEQFEASLLRDSAELQLRQERLKRREQLDAARARLERDPDSAKARNVLKLSQDLSKDAPDDRESMQSIAEAEQTIKRVIGTDDLSHLLRADTAVSVNTDAYGPGRAGRSAPPEDDETKVYSKPIEKQSLKKKAAEGPSLATRLTVPVKDAFARLDAMSVRSKAIALSALAVVVVLAIALPFLSHRQPKPVVVEAPVVAASNKVVLSASPADSSFKVDGIAKANGEISVPANRTLIVEISRIGYKTKTIQLNGKSASQTIALDPLPVRINVATAEKSGYLQLDGSKVGDLVDGSIDGLETPADGKSHTLALIAGGKKLASVEFQANPGERPHLSPISTKDMIAVSALGPAATIYGGELLKNVSMSGTPVRLSNAGTDLATISDQHNELVYADGTGSGTLTLAATEWPSLTLRSLAAQSEIFITANVENATLTANGAVVKRGRRGWRITQANTYVFFLSAENYESQTWTAELKPRQTLQQVRKLEPKIVQATSSMLAISGGTPGAQVEVDGRLLGAFDSNGAAQFSSSLSAGEHQVQFRKEGFCPRSTSVNARPPAEVRLSDGKLDPCGSITVPAGLQLTNARARRTGDTKWTDLAPGKRTIVPVGTYEVHAESAGNKPYDAQLKVEAGHSSELAPRFVQQEHCQLQNAAEVSTNGPWNKPIDGNNSRVYLSAGCVNVNLIFQKPRASGLLAKKRVEWFLVFAGGAAEVSYSLEGGKLSRKLTAHNTFDQKTVGVENQVKMDADQFKIRIRVDGNHIKILSENGEVLDDYVSQNPLMQELNGGRVGIKTNSDFQFSGSGQ